MIDPAHPFDVIDEPCETCRHETPHEVAIELRSESRTNENTQYARQPYRISLCTRCGEELVSRVHGP